MINLSFDLHCLTNARYLLDMRSKEDAMQFLEKSPILSEHCDLSAVADAISTRDYSDVSSPKALVYLLIHCPK